MKAFGGWAAGLFAALIAGVLVAFLAQHLIRVYDQKQKAELFIGSVLKLENEFRDPPDAPIPNGLPSFRRAADEVHQQVLAKLTVDPLSLGADNQDVTVLLRAINAQIEAFDRDCGDHPSPEWTVSLCTQAAFLYIKPPVNMLVVALKSRLN
jgi:hypothetical protein